MNAEALVQRIWYGDHPAGWLLIPLSWLFGLLAALRRAAYRGGLLRIERVGVPIIVVGNLNAGGVGKTPVVIEIVRRLRDTGRQVGVVSRGYGGTVDGPDAVTADSDPARCGDEAVLIAQRTGVPVTIAARRADAARALVAQGVEVIVSDDGLQHYALARDCEIAVLDGLRRFGNGRLLPAGPLREPRSRLATVDLVLVNGGRPGPQEFALIPRIGPARRLSDGAERELARFAGPVHAVAGIGHPQRFFDALRAAGLEPIEHPFADHHAFVARDLEFPDQWPVLMTEKDAVKCARFADSRCWAVPLAVRLPDPAWDRIRDRIG